MPFWQPWIKGESLAAAGEAGIRITDIQVCRTDPCADGNACTANGCDPIGGCTSEATDGAPCDDGQPCSAEDLCFDEQCIGLAAQCDDGLSCTLDSCDGAGCVFVPLGEGAPCDDGNPCTAGDSCVGTFCNAGADLCTDLPLGPAPAVDLALSRTTGGGYLAVWGAQTGGTGHLRLTDANDSRLGRQSSDGIGCGGCFPSAATLLNGDLLRTRNSSAAIIVERRSKSGDLLESEDALLWGSDAVVGAAVQKDGRARLFGYSDLSSGMLVSYPSQEPDGNDPLYYVPISVAFEASDPVVLAGATEGGVVDGDTLATGDGFAAVWTNPAQSQYWAGFYDKLGQAKSGPWMISPAGAGYILDVGVLDLPGDLFVAAWTVLEEPAGELIGAEISLRNETKAEYTQLLPVPTVAENIQGEQRYGDMARFSDGGFVVVWDDQNGEDGRGIRARVFDGSANPTSGVLPVNLTQGGDQTDPRVAVIDSNRFVVAWRGDDHVPVTRRFEQTGDPVIGHPERTIAQGTAAPGDIEGAPTTAQLEDTWLVTWSTKEGSDGMEVRSATVDASTLQIGPETSVNLSPTGDQRRPRVVATGDGFRIVFESPNGVVARTLSAGGKPSGIDQPMAADPQADQTEPAQAEGPAGSLVAWAAAGAVRARALDAGLPAGENLTVALGEGVFAAPAIVLAGDDFVLAWSHRPNAGTPDDDVWVRRFGAGGGISAPEKANALTDGMQVAPAIARSPNGALAVCWYGNKTLGSGSLDIRCRVFSGIDPLLETSPEFTPHDLVSGQQQDVDLASVPGGWVAVWTSYMVDGDQNAVQLQAYDWEGAPQGPQVQVNHTILDKQFHPSITAGADGTVAVSYWSGGDGDDAVLLRLLPLELSP